MWPPPTSRSGNCVVWIVLCIVESLTTSLALICYLIATTKMSADYDTCPWKVWGHLEGVVFWNHPGWVPLASCYINLAYKTQYGDQHSLLIGSFSSYLSTQLLLASQLYGALPNLRAKIWAYPCFLQIYCDSLAPEARGLHANSSLIEVHTASEARLLKGTVQPKAKVSGAAQHPSPGQPSPHKRKPGWWLHYLVLYECICISKKLEETI